MLNDSKNLRKETGQQGELAVCNWLKGQGFKIRHCNYMITQGEIDIIAQKDELIVFVEVKTRKTEHFHLSELITRSKQRKIIRTAKQYLLEFQVVDKVCRFDVALVTMGQNESITYLPHAFSSEESF